MLLFSKTLCQYVAMSGHLIVYGGLKFAFSRVTKKALLSLDFFTFRDCQNLTFKAISSLKALQNLVLPWLFHSNILTSNINMVLLQFPTSFSGNCEVGLIERVYTSSGTHNPPQLHQPVQENTDALPVVCRTVMEPRTKSFIQLCFLGCGRAGWCSSHPDFIFSRFVLQNVTQTCCHVS